MAARGTLARAETRDHRMTYRFDDSDIPYVARNCWLKDDEHETDTSFHSLDQDGQLITRLTWKLFAVRDAEVVGAWFTSIPSRWPMHCGCGCPGLTRGGGFLPGHDARRVSLQFLRQSASENGPFSSMLKNITHAK